MNEIVLDAFRDFKRNRVRTILTSLGIMIGVLSVVLLIALGLGLKNYISNQFDKLGANLVIIFPGNVFKEGASFGPGFSGGAKFDEKDYQSLLKIKTADYVVPVYFKSIAIEADREKFLGYIQGVNEQIFPLMNLKIITGRAFGKTDVSKKSKIAVLGYTLAEKLFKDPKNALNRQITINNQRFRVIGVMEKSGDREMDTAAVMPYTTAFGRINPNKDFFALYLGVNNKDSVELLKTQIKTTLLKRYEEDDFSVAEQTEILSSINQIFSIINAVLIAIGSISLVVGGIGIMNIMYASVTERTKEVGIRRAIGATQKDILLQFLIEAVILSVLGGGVGLGLAGLIVLAVQPLFPAAINLTAVLIAFFVSAAIGIIFGVFPARRAAQLAPIEAIRYE
ncbi:MAG: ABC transporter permease [Patescibacteria group bacterium]